ncbi:methyltransferase domain-containing protein [Entomobacter blattae]|uniref:Methyltransferase domain protein n=1 Tax=Entomobacter blattae TaxID=2762277 RepID=A0A7H1NTM9_9PROT|nr:methyltransferase domain-containing protein [Entomobacter blattae]QNT79139.1 Methyltransferase domain protein [Entomobacter blattae]
MDTPYPIPQVFDYKAQQKFHNRASRKIAHVYPILQHAASLLIERLDDITRPFNLALDIGGRGVVAPLLVERKITPITIDCSIDMLNKQAGLKLCSENELLPFAPASFDLVIASLSLHQVNDIPGLFKQIRHILKPDGLFLASLPVLPSFSELRECLMQAEETLCGRISPRIIPFPNLQACAGLLQRAGFTLPVVDSEIINLSYRNPLSILRDLQQAGESNALTQRSKLIPPKGLFPLALSLFADRYGKNDPVPLQLHIACLSAWSPAPTQPQPLTRGEFTTSFEDLIASLPDPPSESSSS